MFGGKIAERLLQLLRSNPQLLLVSVEGEVCRRVLFLCESRRPLQWRRENDWMNAKLWNCCAQLVSWSSLSNIVNSNSKLLLNYSNSNYLIQIICSVRSFWQACRPHTGPNSSLVQCFYQEEGVRINQPPLGGRGAGGIGGPNFGNFGIQNIFGASCQE